MFSICRSHLPRPVDVTAREAEAQQKIEKERDEVREKVAHAPMSRTSSRTGSQRPTPPTSAPASNVQSPTSPQAESRGLPPSNVRPSFSFASAAAGRKDSTDSVPKDDVSKIDDKIDEDEQESTEQ